MQNNKKLVSYIRDHTIMLFVVGVTDIVILISLITTYEISQANTNILYFKIALLCIGAYLVGMGLLTIKHGLFASFHGSHMKLWHEFWTVKFHHKALSNPLKFSLNKSKIYAEGITVRLLGFLVVVLGVLMINYGK